MDNNVNAAFVIPVGLDKVVAAAQSADAVVCPVYVHLFGTAEPRKVNALGEPVSLCADVETGGDTLPDNLVQPFRLDVGLFDTDGLHTTADINADEVRTNLVPDGHRCSNGASCTGVDVGHHPNPLSFGIRLV